MVHMPLMACGNNFLASYFQWPEYKANSKFLIFTERKIFKTDVKRMCYIYVIVSSLFGPINVKSIL